MTQNKMPYLPKEKRKMLEGGCPWCGEALTIKWGKYGEFIACTERCGFTKSMPGRSHYPPPKKQTKCPFNVCDGSGLLPFTGKDGKVRADVHTYCDCHPQYGIDNYDGCNSEPNLSDYDFPLSETFRAWTFEHCGVPDPAYVPPRPQEEAPVPQEIIYRHSDMSSQDFAKLEEHDRTLKYLMGKQKEKEKKQEYY